MVQFTKMRLFDRVEKHLEENLKNLMNAFKYSLDKFDDD